MLYLPGLGGRQAIRGRWPWQVAILNKYREVFCGGTLVAPGWILTAAHCARKHLFVRLGEHDIVEKEGSELEYAVEEVKLHPLYNPDTVDNDVALLKIPSLITKPTDNPPIDEDFPTPSVLEDLNFRNLRKSRRLRKENYESKESRYFPSVCLPEQDEDLPVGTHCTIIGWGKKKSSNVFGTDVLHEAEVITPFLYLLRTYSAFI